MKKTYTIAGIGVCLGKKPGCEVLAEAVITKTPVAGKERTDALALAVREALQGVSQASVYTLTDTRAKDDRLGEQKLCGSFREMLEAAPENALLLSHRENGWLAIALTQADKGYAKVTLTDSNDRTQGDDFLNFLLSAMEIRYAIHLDDRERLYRFWDSADRRSKELAVTGVKCCFTEPSVLSSRIYKAGKYLLPVVFTTVQEAKQKLEALKQKARSGLDIAMEASLPELALRNDSANTIVLLASSYEMLVSDITSLMEKAEHLLDEGFTWKSRSGSRYIRRSCSDPKVVFMNSPGGMFNAKPFYNFFFKHYITLDEASRFETDQFLTGSEDNFLSRALFDMVVNHTVTTLLSEVGIESDIRSGACQGELSIEFPYMKDADGNAGSVDNCLGRIRDAVEMAMRGDAQPLEAYLGRKVDKFTKYYLKCDQNKVRQAAEKYDSVFIWIVGSLEDVIVAGEQEALLKLIDELGCVSTEMGDPLYIHTPIMEAYRQQIRQNLLDAGLYLDVDKLPFKLFSTFYRRFMDSTPEMLADNITNLIIDEVDYASAVQTLYAEGGRVFIDLSTMQVCGGWASATLKQQKDASVLSIYSGDDAAADLLNFAAVMLAGNVRFDYKKLLAKLSFSKDRVEAETPVKKEVTPMAQIPALAVQPVKTPITGAEFAGIVEKQIMNNARAYELFMDAQNKLFAQLLGAAAAPAAAPVAEAKKNYLWDRQQAITMTGDSMAAVLGDQYKEVDQYPIRARMPLPPFMFVSRIVSIDAEFGKLRPSSIVSEYDLDEDCVFRMGDSQVSPLIGSEASHIGIFLLAYMGIDAMFNGTISYRAIGSSQVTHSERPFRVGDTMRTVLRINSFVQNGSTILVFFTFETYNGNELIFVTETTGGFFTKEQLTSNKGVIGPKKVVNKLPPVEFVHESDLTVTSYDKEQMEAFYRGDHEGCFGKIKKCSMREPYHLPHDLKMIDRVTNIDYNGGMYGRGIICGEKQITPDMWPFKAHFKNDPVFPAIIMTDGVTQLGMFLFTYAGLLSKFKKTVVTAIKGNTTNSKFRGQARHGYSTLRYEVHVREVVQTEDSISVYFDAKIFNDGLQIIQVESYALKIASDTE